MKSPTSLLSTAGRIGRLEYFLWSNGLFFGYIFVVWAIMYGANPETPAEPGAIAQSVIGILYLPMLAVVGFILPIKRWHDMGKSGWMVLVSFIPLANIVAGLMLLFAPGTKGPNQYGQDPLAPAISEPT